jgi:hypothetical protein
MTGLAAVAALDVPTRIVTCVGFGGDAYQAFDLATVARQNLYLDRLETTFAISDVELAIESFHATARCRSAESIPL